MKQNSPFCGARKPFINLQKGFFTWQNRLFYMAFCNHLHFKGLQNPKNTDYFYLSRSMITYFFEPNPICSA